MKLFVVLSTILAVAYAQEVTKYAPIPYSFNYVAEGDEGSSGHQESGDGAGNVQGSYTVTDQDGRNRVVEYVAGPEGFRAVVRTNEPGTDNSAPADVVFESSSPDAKGPIIRYNTAPATGRPQAGIYNPPAGRPTAGNYYPTAGRPTAGNYNPTGRVAVRQPQNTRYVLVPSTDPRASGRY